MCVWGSHETVNRFTELEDRRTNLKREPGQDETRGGREALE